MTTQVKYKLGEREANGLCRVIALVFYKKTLIPLMDVLKLGV